MMSIDTLRRLAGLLLALATCVNAGAQDRTPPPPERLGLYDSRAVAIAYAGSPLMAKSMQVLKDRHRQAKAAGDTKEVSRLEAEGAALQRRLHDQGFGTAPVDDLLGLIADRLPAIRQAAGVTAIVSKWDREALARHPDARTRDVTMALVDAFGPSEKARRNAVEIQSRPPRPHAGSAEDS